MEPTLSLLYRSLPERKSDLPDYEDGELVFRQFVAHIRDLVSK